MLPNKKTARIAGLLFLLMVLSGLFAELFFRQKIFTDDAAEFYRRVGFKERGTGFERVVGDYLVNASRHDS